MKSILYALIVIISYSACAFSSPKGVALLKLASHASPKVIELGLKAYECARKSEQVKSSILTIIDYQRPSLEPRLWVFDLKHERLLFEELVAHGRNSGENYARNFSNELESKMSSLGLFLTADTYSGENGYSLRLYGLEKGINDKAFERLIVMHGANYVNQSTAIKQGRLGRSWGCPAVRPEIAQKLIDTVKEGSLIFIYYPNNEWLSSSIYLNC